MQNVEENIFILSKLKKLGVRLSLDDFGTGYSSLSHLKNFPIDRIKIDRSFVQDIIVDENDRVIVETIIAMADRLGMEVLAEGVETDDQRNALLERNCHLMQGFYYAKPMSPSDLQFYIEKIKPPQALSNH
jgi:EAL domain-containing protein (putative c-di-GMP-specific phosphodiesterase class I)